MLSEHQLLLHFTQNFMGYVGIELKPAPCSKALMQSVCSQVIPFLDIIRLCR